ncbi:YetF domain-containing protein [Bacillus sp. FJAT-27251]|uniref:DUF421 domain-containing protein n=1 Tax=Bacillus sp. FJAT-27251 TaxID=1684142 RepID=UPI0006A76784|nr:YetF domain-containing protein [Bacillus sp. FJAT-27251]
MSFLWKAIVLILSGIILLRIAGRKSISQMTLAQTVVMISIGTVIVQPIVNKSVVKAVVGAAAFVAVILILEYLQLKFNWFETALSGKSKTVVVNGKLDIKNMKKLRLTADQLEMRLRGKGITRFQDLKVATIEPNGLLGYELKEDAKPVTVGELKKILNSYGLQQQDSNQKGNESSATNQQNIFTEINSSKDQNHADYLQ